MLALGIFFCIYFPVTLIAIGIAAFVFAAGLGGLIYQQVTVGEPTMAPYVVQTIAPLLLGIVGASIMWG